MATIAITEPFLRKYNLPEGTDRVRLFDGRLAGFGVVVGKRSTVFIARHRVDGMRRDVTIGTWGKPGAGPDHSEIWTEARARKEAQRLLGTMASGVDPVVKRAKSTGGPTLRDGFEAHVSKLRKKVRAGKRSEETIRTFEKSLKYVETWLDRPISELTGEVLNALHDQIKRDAAPRAGTANDTGAPLANRTITNISSAWASLNQKLEGKLGTWNPAKSVVRDELVGRRSRVDDLPDWYARVQTMTSPVRRDGLMLALFTGLRHEDVRTIRFEHVDFDARTLRLPDPKGGRNAAFTIPLSATCIEILERRQENNHEALGRDDEGWGFPFINSDDKVTAIGELRQRKSIGPRGDQVHTLFPAESVHDLRRTFLSVAQEAGISEMDQHVLSNHSFGNHNVNASYVVQHIDHLTTCADKIDAALWARLKPAPGSKSTKSKSKSRGKLHAV